MSDNAPLESPVRPATETEDGARIVYVAIEDPKVTAVNVKMTYESRVQVARGDAFRFALESQYKRMPKDDAALENFDWTEDNIIVAKRIEQYLLTGE